MDEIRISPSDAAKRVESGAAMLLDVVTESAWRSLREVPRGAVRIPPEELSSRLDEIPAGRGVSLLYLTGRSHERPCGAATQIRGP